MKMKVGLMSDTHGRLDPRVLECFSACDEIWHAGDIGSSEVLEQLASVKPVRAVYGNIDGPDVRNGLPEDLEWESGGMRIYMTHIGGYPGKYDARARREIVRRRPGLFICGHSHILRVMRDADLGLVHMNPGSCGFQGWHQVRTILRFTIDDGVIRSAEAVELAPRYAP
jgi:uncharacterized protein